MVLRHFILSLAIEFGPTIVFFFGAIFKGFFFGVWCLIGATILSMGVSLIRDSRIPIFLLIASTFVLLSGFATLFTHNPYWVVIEYTLYNSLFAAAICVGWLLKKPLFKPLFSTLFNLTDRGWQILSLRWGVFFMMSALGSEFIWRNYGDASWVYYRFVMSIILVVFGLSQLFLIKTHRMPDASPWGLRMRSQKGRIDMDSEYSSQKTKAS